MSTNERRYDSEPSVEASTLDMSIAAAMNSIPVPSGLEERLKNSLQSHLHTTESVQGVEVDATLDETNDLVELQSIETKQDQTRQTRRRVFGFGIGATVVAACLAFAMLGMQRSLSTDDLATHAIGQLEDSNQWSSTSFLPPTLHAFIYQNLQDTHQRPITEFTGDAAQFGDVCKIWKLSGAGDDLFVIAITNSTQIQNLSSRLQVICDSGPWSIAAMQSNDNQIFLVATRSDVRSYFRPNQYA